MNGGASMSGVKPSIKITGGTANRSRGKTKDITPPSLVVETINLISHVFGSFPCELMTDDLSRICLIVNVAEVYAPGHWDMWKDIEDAIDEYGCVTVVGEY